MFKYWFAFAPHVGKHSLAEVPAQQMVWRAQWVLKEAVSNMRPGKTSNILLKEGDFVIVLEKLLVTSNPWGRKAHTSGLMEKQ